MDDKSTKSGGRDTQDKESALMSGEVQDVDPRFPSDDGVRMNTRYNFTTLFAMYFSANACVSECVSTNIRLRTNWERRYLSGKLSQLHSSRLSLPVVLQFWYGATWYVPQAQRVSRAHLQNSQGTCARRPWIRARQRLLNFQVTDFSLCDSIWPSAGGQYHWAVVSSATGHNSTCIPQY